MDVCLLVPGPGKQTGGIGRYVSELHERLPVQDVRARLAVFSYLPGANRRSVLKAVPIGAEIECRSGIAHFTRIMGASMLLFRHPQNSIVTVHDLGALMCDEDKKESNTITRLLFHLSLAGMRRANRIIADSNFTRQCVIDHLRYDQTKVDAVHLGVDTERFRLIHGARERLQSRYRIKFSETSSVLLYVGSEQPRKNLTDLIHAISILKGRGREVQWLKVG